MPFKSDKQRKYLYKNKPKVAKKWAKKYVEGGSPKEDFLKIDKSLSDTSASVDTNKGPNILNRQDLARQHKINKQQKFDESMRHKGGTISAPKHVEQAQAAARLNPVSGPIANIASLFKPKNKKMEKGGVFKKKKKKRVRKYFLGGLMKKIASVTPLGMGIKALKDWKERKKGAGSAGEMGKSGGDGAHNHKADKNNQDEIDKKSAIEEGIESSGGGVAAAAGLMKKGGIMKNKKSKISKTKRSYVNGPTKIVDWRKFIINNKNKDKNKNEDCPDGSCPLPKPEWGTKEWKEWMEKNTPKRKYVEGGKFNPDKVSQHKGVITTPKITETTTPPKTTTPLKTTTINKPNYITEFGKKQVKKKIGIQALKLGTATAVAHGAPKVVGKVGSRFIPGLGYGLLAADAGKLFLKNKRQTYAEMDERSPGTSKSLETGAYGQQTSDSGHKVRGTFFSAMKKEGGIVRKYVEGGKLKPPIKKVETLEKTILDGAGVSGSKKGERDMRSFIKNKEEKLYRSTGRKPPRRNIFKGGGTTYYKNKIYDSYEEAREAMNTKITDWGEDEKSRYYPYYGPTIEEGEHKGKRKVNKSMSMVNPRYSTFDSDVRKSQKEAEIEATRQEILKNQGN